MKNNYLSGEENEGRLNSKYNTVSVYSLIVICCSIIFYFVASQIGSFSEK